MYVGIGERCHLNCVVPSSPREWDVLLFTWIFLISSSNVLKFCTFGGGMTLMLSSLFSLRLLQTELFSRFHFRPFMASAWKDGLRFVFMFCVLIINTLTGGFSTPLPLFFLTPVFLTRPLHSSRGKGTTLAGIRLFFKEGLCLPREPHRPPLAGRPVGLTQPFPSEVEGLQMLARGSLFQKSLIGRAWTLALPDGFSFPLLPLSLIPSHANLYTHP